MIVLGIDFGGTGIKSALVDCATGQLVSERVRVRTPHKARPDDIGKLIHRLVLQQHWTGRIGIGFPAVIRDEMAMNTANFSKKWVGMDVAQFIGDVTGCSTSVINDADAAGLAEMTFGAGRDYVNKVVLLLTVGMALARLSLTKASCSPILNLATCSLKAPMPKNGSRITSVAKRISPGKNGLAAFRASWMKWRNYLIRMSSSSASGSANATRNFQVY